MDMILQKKMHKEAIERLELMGAGAEVIAKFSDGKQLTKSDVDVEHFKVYDRPLTDEEIKMVCDFEQEYNTLVYYVIKDKGFWPDGCLFDRYSLLYVSRCEDEWEMDKEDAIKLCNAVPAYVVNVEEPDCSEITEFAYQCVSGYLVNVS